MSRLQEVLSVLLGAESEAARIVEEAKKLSGEVVKDTQDSFEPQRKGKMASARESAKSIMANAREAAETEADQIRDLGADEREKIEKRYLSSVDSVVAAMVEETKTRILVGGR